MSMPPKPPNSLVIAVDGSENARRAVVYIGDLLGGLDGFGVILLHVIHAPEDDFFASPAERERWIITGREKVSGWLAGYRELLIAAGFPPACVSVRTAERDGPSLAHLILDEVAALGARTVVMGRQGLSRREAFLFGSVSRQVVDRARNLTVWVVQ